MRPIINSNVGIRLDIAILDFGGQYVFNIRRNLLEQGVSAEVLSYNTSAQNLVDLQVKGIILSGGPYSVYDAKAPICDPEILDIRVPILGLCYGQQLITHLLGGKVKKGQIGEYGFSEVDLEKTSTLFQGLSSREICWMSHGDIVEKIPPGFKVIGSTPESKIAAFHKKNIYGLQFHPEVSHTPHGYLILKNFAQLCQCTLTGWDVRNFIATAIHNLKKSIQEEKAIIALSGGVDSTTAAILAFQALKENLICVHVDHGLMRKDESKNVTQILRSLGLNVVFIDASSKFQKALREVADPDQKRRIIGHLFIEEFEKVAEETDSKWLIQGTIAPDIIESTRGEAKRKSDRGHGGLIKIHHNVAGLPKGMKLNLIEPLSPLFKYQVRILARELHMPQDIAERQPFPGPGLGCRIAGEISSPKIQILREVDAMVEKELKKYTPSQYFAILLNNRFTGKSEIAEMISAKYVGRTRATVLKDDCIGVKGDERVIGKMVVLQNPMKSVGLWQKSSWLDILRLQNEITGSIKDVCRVSLLLTEIGDQNSGYGIIIRAVDTIDFMTAIPTKIDLEHLSDVATMIIEKHSAIKFVGYEVTTKPAATIELI